MNEKIARRYINDFDDQFLSLFNRIEIEGHGMYCTIPNIGQKRRIIRRYQAREDIFEYLNECYGTLWDVLMKNPPTHVYYHDFRRRGKWCLPEDD
jgi:hypothetical protein